MSLRICIADDHEIVRRGVRALIADRPDWTLAGEASDGLEAVEMVRRLAPDIAILDVSMPKLNGLDAARQIRANTNAKVLILTMHSSDALCQQAIEAGAQGVLLKSDAGDELIQAIEAVTQDKLYLTPHHSETMLDLVAGSSGGQPTIPLTPRERELLRRLCEGATNKEIAVSMAISVRTVETYRASVRDKLGLKSTGELIRWALRNHLVEP